MEDSKLEKPVIRLSAKTGRPVEIRSKSGNTQYKCDRCGKWLVAEDSIEAEEGHYCETLYAKYSPEDLKALRESRTVANVPLTETGETWVKTKAVHKLCEKHSIPISRLVRAFGGDRGTLEPLDERFRYVYCGKARYVHPWCATKEGLAFLRSVQSDPTVPLKEAPKAVKSVKPAVANVSAIEEAFAEVTG